MLEDNIQKQVEEVLESFAKKLIESARDNLKKNKKNVSNTLSDSMGYEIEDGQLIILMESYGKFVDEGVNGISNKYNTPYKYSKMPNITALSEYAKSRGLKLRDSKGRFKKGGYKTIGFLIARKLLNEGLKPSYFLKNPYDKQVRALSKDIINNINL